MAKSEVGHVYVLQSPNSRFVKIGGTAHPPFKRIKEINGVSPYRELGPWTRVDSRQVTDWRLVEANLHYTFRSALVLSVSGQKELFDLGPREACARLDQIDPQTVVSRPKIDRLFEDADFAEFLQRFFRFTGLVNFLHLQGCWVLVLFPGTGRGRFFTISIGNHEVAFAALPEGPSARPYHTVLLDRLILDFPAVVEWAHARGGGVFNAKYKTAMPRAVNVAFYGSFAEAIEFLSLEGVRRALIAYWGEALIQHEEREAASVFGRHHNYNAVSELCRRISMSHRSSQNDS